MNTLDYLYFAPVALLVLLPLWRAVMNSPAAQTEDSRSYPSQRAAEATAAWWVAEGSQEALTARSVDRRAWEVRNHAAGYVTMGRSGM